MSYEYQKLQMNRLMNEDEDLTADLGTEIHALSSAAKPLCSWTARDAIQDCRESCGGHGYLKSKYKILFIKIVCIYINYYHFIVSVSFG